MKTRILGMVAGLALGTATAAGAQIFTPTYMSPVPLNDLGVYISDGPGDLTLEGIWRGGPLGLRVGFVDGDADDALSVGGEFRSPLPLAGAPLSLAFSLGAQALVGDFDRVGFQAGLSAGHRFTETGLAFTPYLHPRIALIETPADDFEAEVLADVGVDVEFQRNLIFRLGINLSDGPADWGIGFAWRR